MESKRYFLGLDIGTDSVGYAVTDDCYRLCKFKGEPVWGTTLFETAQLAEERRSARTARRRLDRRKQRIHLLEEIFALEIGKIDPNFFIRRRESALFEEDTQFGVKLFDGGITDKEYHEHYPTIHHLLVELMKSEKPHDIRLVYIACAWLVAHRGHFLFDTADGQIKDFDTVYGELCDYLYGECECTLPWDTDVSAEDLLKIMTAQVGVKKKQTMFAEHIYGGKKPSKKPDEGFPYSRDAIVMLLCGGKVAPKDLFANEDYAELESVSLSMDEDNSSRILGTLGEDGELLSKLRAMYVLKGKKDIAFVPIELMYAERLMTDKAFAAEYIASAISDINGCKPIEDVRLLLGGRKIKINTVIEADGMRLVLKGKSNGGATIIVSPCVPLILGTTTERYVKRLEAFAQKRRDGATVVPDESHDHITVQENMALYDLLYSKLTDSVFAKCPGNIAATVTAGRDKFVALTIEEQITCLLSIVSWFGNIQTCNLESIGGAKKSGVKTPNSRLAAWKKNYSDVRIVDTSASGLFESRSENLLELI